MPSLAARALKLYASRTVRTTKSLPKAALVQHLRRTMDHPPPLPFVMPPMVRLTRFRDGRVEGDWLQVKSAKRAVLYLHGGGYVAGVTKTYHPLCSRLASELTADVFLPEYRLAPEHPFPAALDDAVAAYDRLLDHGWRAEHIIIAGDSAGGGLTLATLLRLRDEGKPLPACAIVMSPFADVTATAPSVQANDDSDALLSAAMLVSGRNIYVPDPAREREPWASPAFGDYTGLPPLMVLVEETECLRDDAYTVADRARAAGVPVDFVSRRGLLHVWPIFWPLLPEAREDVARMVAFVRRRVPARA